MFQALKHEKIEGEVTEVKVDFEKNSFSIKSKSKSFICSLPAAERIFAIFKKLTGRN
jgi:hypothetical protein